MTDSGTGISPARSWDELIALSKHRGRYLRRRQRVLAAAPVLAVALAVAAVPLALGGREGPDRLEVAVVPTPPAPSPEPAPAPQPQPLSLVPPVRTGSDSGGTPAPGAAAGAAAAAGHQQLAPLAGPRNDGVRPARPAAPDPLRGDVLLFQELVPGEDGSKLALLSLGSGGKSIRITKGSGKFERADFSPDGRRIAYQSAGRNGHKGWQIYVADTDGGNERRLTHPVGCEQSDNDAESPNCFDIEPRWSPDGAAIAFTRGLAYPGCENVHRNCAQIHLLSPDTARTEPLVSGWAPSWSPDGSQLVYVALEDEAQAASCERALAYTCNGTLHIVNRDGTKVRSLGVKGYGPRWSPDGRWIVFEGDHAPSEPHQARLVRPDGTGLRAVLPVNHEEATWTPDGRLLSTLVRDGQRDVWISRADGSGPRQLTSTPSLESFPVLRPRLRG